MAQKRKQTTRKKTTRKTKKPKVYIPAYKIIILCALIITVCMGLLLVTTVKSPEEKPVMTERYDEKKEEQKKESSAEKSKESVKKDDDKKVSSEKTKAETKTEKKSQTKTETAKKETQKKAEPVKETKSETKTETKTEKKTETQPETKKQESKPAVIETPQVKEEKKASTPPQTTTPKTEAASTPAKEQTPAATTPATSKSSYNFPKAVNNAQLIFVFDDGGQNLNHLKPFLELPFPITIAVLPRLTHSVESAKRIRASGKELMLHQPMQAVNNSVNPGPGAIKPEMSESEIISTLFYNINEIGPIAGLNNHEGSAITADAEKMAVVMKISAENGVFFLDSRTNKDTQVPYVAKEMGYSYYERNGYFLDNEKTKANALKELRRNLDIANKTGSVIMIGHIWSADFLPEFLMEVYPELKEKGYTFTTVSKSRAKKN